MTKETEALCNRFAGKKLKPDEVYYMLFKTMHDWLSKRAKADPDYFTEDKVNRIANTHAVKNTIELWRKQWQS